MTKFLTIREAARREDCPIPEHRLRQLVKTGAIESFPSGNRRLIDPETAFAKIRAAVGANQGAAV